MGSDALLELVGVEKRYPEGPVVLAGVTLRVAAGESVAIVGPSGSGKSTLLHVAGTLDRPSAGTVRIAGQDISGLDDRALAMVRRRDVGFVFQQHHLLPQCTALENVLVPLLGGGGRVTPEAEARARALLEQVGLGARLLHRPAQLSGGERQRVAVARALIHGPRAVLADEPTGSLDRAAAAEIGELLARLHREQGVALVVVTHSEALAARMQRTLALDGGVLR